MQLPDLTQAIAYVVQQVPALALFCLGVKWVFEYILRLHDQHAARMTEIVSKQIANDKENRAALDRNTEAYNKNSNLLEYMDRTVGHKSRYPETIQPHSSKKKKAADDESPSAP